MKEKMISAVSQTINRWAQDVLSEPDKWDRRVRLGFVLFGTVCSGTLAFTTRHYVNGDAIAYLDMADAFRRGCWSDTVNLTYAPGYSLLLSFVLMLLPVAPVYEIALAKFFNFLCFVAALWVCDFFVRELNDYAAEQEPTRGFPRPVLSSICFALFLFSSLAWVRVQIITPDMLVFIFLLLCVVALMRIIRRPDEYASFILLGLSLGLGYVCKTFFFPFSALLFACAAAGCRSVSHALPRLAAVAAAMLMVGAPVLVSQSLRAQRLSFGEAGSYNYAFWVSGAGQAVHQPEVIHSDPKVLIYREGTVSTYPQGDDPAYWAVGIRPVFDFQAQLRALRENITHLVGRAALPGLVILLWFAVQVGRAKPFRPRFFPPSVGLVLMLLGVAGTAMYCLVVMEIRYVAPFMFLGFVGLAVQLRCDPPALGHRPGIVIEGAVLVLFLTAAVCYSAVDQSVRALHDAPGKASHRAVFGEAVALGNFLSECGIRRGDEVAVFTPPGGVLYWARMIGVRMTGDVEDAKDFLDRDAPERQAALKALQNAGFKALVGKGERFADLEREGWLKPPGTRDYYVCVFTPCLPYTP